MPANRNFTAVPQQSMAEERIERSKSKKMAAGAKFTARKARKERLPSRMSQAPIDRDTSVLFPKMQMEEELQWLPDPFRLAEHVAELLQSPRAIDHLKALALTRQASRRGQVVVSWNHLIDWNMGHGHAQEAVKLFQEMKKRGQKPDAHTYTTLFRGFGKSASYPKTLERTLSIYHSMYSDNSPIQPNIIHTNAVLNVCARSRDMDALFGVAAKLPSRGQGAPDRTTFTIILNGIHAAATHELAAASLEGNHDKENLRKTAVLQGRRIWDEVKARWAKGDLYLDEPLIFAMGRLLLIGQSQQDVSDIFALIEQTMDVPVQTHLDAFSLPNIEESGFLSDEDDDGGKATAATFLPLETRKSPIPTGCKTLTLVLDACLFLHLPRAAQGYWDLITQRLRPDQQCYISYLRGLRYRRASKLAVELAEDLMKSNSPIAKVDDKIIRLAFACCDRDGNNPHAFDHAQRVYHVMRQSLEVADPKALARYIDCAEKRRPRDWRIMLRTLQEVQEDWAPIRSQAALNLAEARNAAKLQSAQLFQLMCLTLARRVVQACTALAVQAREELDGESKAQLAAIQRPMSAFIARLDERLEQKSKQNLLPKGHSVGSSTGEEEPSTNK